MDRMIILWNILVFILCTSTAYSASLNPQSVKLGNQVLVDILHDISNQKDSYKELADLSEKNLLVQKNGLYMLQYEYFGVGQSTTMKSYGLNIQLLPLMINKKTKLDDENYFRYDYPILGLSLVGSQFRALKSKQIDIRSIVENNQLFLAEKQQEKLPFRLSVKTIKDSVKENEDIEIEVTLKNVTGHSLKVKKLSAKTLRFTIDNNVWGTTEISSADTGRGQHTILKAGESLKKTFKGKGLNRFKEFKIYCYYNMGHHGVNPMAILKVRIVHALPSISL